MRKSLSYIKYFFYLAYNWNIKIALHILRQEIKGEEKYGITTTGADELRSLEKKGIEIDHSTIYMPVSYDVLEDVCPHPAKESKAHFLDIGCGKGRAMCVAAANGFTKVTGIDFSKEFCNAAAVNLAITKQKFPGLQYKIINNDAFYFEIPNDVDCIFMFNPFDEIIMDAVAENILESFEIAPRTITLIYANPLHKEKLLEVGFKQIYHTQKMNYLEAVILELK
ncbi:class I SAM-dependent methyltransferase [Ferruginibacter sp. SUN106]|uniref:class I SAM-dependent methyltransferase n=1 Tax=Ferruginibacter sp. SUN106 TaxID=2978348 RepID=UPI003D3627F6